MLCSEVVIAVDSLIYIVPIVVIELVDGPARAALRRPPATVSTGRPSGPSSSTSRSSPTPALISGTAYGAILGFDVFFVRIFAPAALPDYAAARSLALPMLLVPFALSVVLLPQVAAAPRRDIGLLFSCGAR